MWIVDASTSFGFGNWEPLISKGKSATILIPRATIKIGWALKKQETSSSVFVNNVLRLNTKDAPFYARGLFTGANASCSHRLPWASYMHAIWPCHPTISEFETALLSALSSLKQRFTTSSRVFLAQTVSLQNEHSFCTSL